MKPLPAVKPQEKLPEVFHLTIVQDPDKGSRMYCIVLSKTQGDKVIQRKVMEPSVMGMDEAMDEFNKIGTRVFYFGEGEEHIQP